MLPAMWLAHGSQTFGLHWEIPLSLIFFGGHLGVRNQKCCMPWLSWGGINVTWTSHPLSPGRWELFRTGQGYLYKWGHGYSDVGIPWSAIIGLNPVHVLWHQLLVQRWTWVAPASLLPGKLGYTCHTPTLQPGFLSGCPALDSRCNLWFFVCFFNLKLKQLELSVSQVSKMWLSSAPGTSHVILVVGQYVLLNIR